MNIENRLAQLHCVVLYQMRQVTFKREVKRNFGPQV